MTFRDFKELQGLSMTFNDFQRLSRTFKDFQGLPRTSNDFQGPYLIFVLFLHQQIFLENKIYNEKRVNYNKRILRQNSVNQDLLGQATKKCVSLHTECKSTLGLCKNRKYT